MEVELKLLIDAADVAAFRHHPLLAHYALSAAHTQQLTSIYFDTPELALRRGAAALRVRRVGRDWVQTFKAGGRVDAGLHQREEWESRVAGPALDLAALRALIAPDSEWGALLSDAGLADSLQPIFTTRFRRRIWMLRSVHGDVVELALDQGAVHHGALQTPISEIELELKNGNPAALFELALAFQETIALHVGSISKAERGYALCAPQPPMPAAAQAPVLAADLTVARGFHVIVSNCLAQIQANEAGIAQGVDPESVHQMRVGVRRLRSALALFDKRIPCPPALKAELAWLASALGEARDWEVLATTTLSSVRNTGRHAPRLAPLRRAVLQLAQASRENAATALASMRYARLVLTLGAWMLDAGCWCDSAPAERGHAPSTPVTAPLKPFAAKKLARLHHVLCRRGRRLKSGAAPDRHRVRIAAKKLRYAVEFFQSYFSDKQNRALLHALAALQEVLGKLNDVAVARRLLRDLALRQADLAKEVDFACDYLDRHALRDLRKLGKRWHAFERL